MPAPSHIHYSYLQLHFYEKNFCDIIGMISDGHSSRNTGHPDTSQDGGVVVGQSRLKHDEPQDQDDISSRTVARQKMTALAGTYGQTVQTNVIPKAPKPQM